MPLLLIVLQSITVDYALIFQVGEKVSQVLQGKLMTGSIEEVFILDLLLRIPFLPKDKLANGLYDLLFRIILAFLEVFLPIAKFFMSLGQFL